MMQDSEEQFIEEENEDVLSEETETVQPEIILKACATVRQTM
jgi:hypothetical protein